MIKIKLNYFIIISNILLKLFLLTKIILNKSLIDDECSVTWFVNQKVTEEYGSDTLENKYRGKTSTQWISIFQIR